jgi:hypothetical protein
MLLFLCVNYAYSQNNTAGVHKVISSIESYHKLYPSEKLYLHFDKPYYTIGDTLWFKSYLLTSATYQASALSSKLYVELLNDSSQLVSRLVIPLSAGLGQGYFALNNKIRDGSYKVRAYTNWMQNFGVNAFFTKQFYIGKPSLQGSWVVNEQHSVKTNAAGNQVDLAIQLNDLDGQAIPYRDVEIKLLEGCRTVLRSNKITSDVGTFNTSFTLPLKSNNADLTLLITDKTGKNSNLSIPFYPGGSAQNIDLQFMPEGGSMVAGLYNKIGFKAISDDGRGLTVKGVIRNSQNEDVITFQTLHNGMGNFMLRPVSGERYTADITTADGITKTINLPLLKTTGIALRIDNINKPDSVGIFITATQDIAAAKKTYTLVALSKDVVHFGTSFNLNNGFNNVRIAKNKFKTGIVSFLIMDDHNQPVCERRIFINLHDQLKLSIANSRDRYLSLDSIALMVKVTDKAGKPFMGSFSVSVTDDGSVNNKGGDDNILSRFLLTSELKGNIEEPGWYFLDNDAGKEKALDNLLLTQGWTGYDWTATLNPSPKFEAEIDNSVSGKLLNAFKKPIAHAQVTLYASTKKYGTIAIDTFSDAAGKFRFSDLPLYDTIAYTIKAHSSKGKSLGAVIVLDEFKPAAIALTYPIRSMPWYAKSSDSLMLKYFNRPNQPIIPGLRPSEIKGNLLKEVQIKAKKQRVTIGDEDGFPIRELNEQQLIAARKKSLLSLLFEKFTSFRETYIFAYNMMEKPGSVFTQDKAANTNFCIGTSLIYDVFIDGKSMRRINGSYVTQDSTTYYNALKEFFSYVGADDIKDVKIMGGFHTFMTITTRSGAGPFTHISAGNMAYRPLPMLLPKQFYSPRYTVKSNSNQLDNRTTIYWEPNLVTDENGKATLSFYAADKLSTYTVRIEGTNMAGGFCSQTGKISVTSKTTASK